MPLVFTVHLHIRAEALEAFKALTLMNLEESRREPGCVRFDALQVADDPCRFVLYEIWRDAEAHAAHRETAHYQAWKEQVEAMQAERRSSVRYESLAPLA